ncbi:terpene synthase family protein [Streptomyces sp. NPDC097619]|uniref:terpene synthase family protein n=1 Tax=Streptomyces sp. NPDC097619 TaxID=3157228 RepID=UPI003331D0D2
MPAHDITKLLDLPELRVVPGERKASWGEELDDHVIEFACDTGLLTTEAARRFYRTQRIGTMCAYVIPGSVSRRRHRIYGELMMWLFIYDDWAEQLGRYLPPHEVTAVTDTVHTWFADDEEDVRVPDLSLPRSLRLIWNEVRKDTSPAWRRRLRTELRGYLDTAAHEAGLVRTGRVTPFTEARELRPLATAARPVFTMAEHAYGIEMPAEVARHPFLMQAGQSSAIGIALANDIISVKADLLRGIRDNLVLALQEEFGGDLQLNAARAAARYHRAAAEFTALRDRFHSPEGPPDPALSGRRDVAVHLQILDDWLYEGIKWQLRETDRYSTTVRLTQEEHPNQLLGLAERLRADRSGLRPVRSPSS